MKRAIYLSSLIAVFICASVVTGCRKYDDPDPEKVWQVAEIQREATDGVLSIKDFKDTYYYAIHGNAIGNVVRIYDNIAIQGKVISSDKENNVERSIYIDDGTGAIEIKIGEYGTYLSYPPGRTVYIMLKGLVLSNNRYMLSVGRADDTGEYPNTWLTTPQAIKQHVRKGYYGTLTPSDTIVISSFTGLPSGENAMRELYGRLVRFEGLRSTYGTFDGEPYPSFFYSLNGVYNTYTYEYAIQAWRDYDFALAQHNADPVNFPLPDEPLFKRPGNITGPTYAYRSDGLAEAGAAHKFYGTALYQFADALGNTTPEGNLLVRTSGYATFALNRLPADGATVDITCIFTKYSSNSGGFQKYQLLLNKVSDVRVR